MTTQVARPLQDNPQTQPIKRGEKASVSEQAGRTWTHCKSYASSSASYVGVVALVVGFIAALVGAGVFSSYLQVSLRGIGSIPQAYGLYTLLSGSVVTFVTGVLLLATCLTRKAGGAHERAEIRGESWKNSCVGFLQKCKKQTAPAQTATESAKNSKTNLKTKTPAN